MTHSDDRTTAHAAMRAQEQAFASAFLMVDTLRGFGSDSAQAIADAARWTACAFAGSFSDETDTALERLRGLRPEEVPLDRLGDLEWHADRSAEEIETALAQLPLEVVIMGEIGRNGELAPDGQRAVDVLLTMNGPTIYVGHDRRGRPYYGTSETPSNRYEEVDESAESVPGIARFVSFVSGVEA